MHALISVSDKQGIVDFAGKLSELGVKIISTGGTARVLRENNLDVQEVSEITGFPEMISGRVKTLHPKVHAGILALRDNECHMSDLQKQSILPIDLVVVNLYPFEKVTANPDADLETAIENIDIGGPSMIRSAAKNYKHVAVVVDPNDYSEIIGQIKSSGRVSIETRRKLALKAFRRTAEYDSCIDSFLREKLEGDKSYCLSYSHGTQLRYGENPHQKAVFYRESNAVQSSVGGANVLHGKQLSFNNIMDANAAINLIAEFDQTACAILKHTNPCGCAVADTNIEAYKRALECDPTSAFGGIVVFNSILDLETAKEIANMFVELVIAPKFENSALEVLMKKKNLRILETGHPSIIVTSDIRSVDGGLLVQDKDVKQLRDDEITIATEISPTKEQLNDLKIAWKIVKHIKSNAIIFVKDGRAIGIGAGQMSRVDSTMVAVKKAENAKLSLNGAVMASDAFFPFPDSIETAAKAGIKAIIQPGGSIRDAQVIDAANNAAISMVFTGFRAFKH